MRRLSVVTFALLSACELQPAPRQQAAPTPAPTRPPVIEAADAGVVIDAPAAPVFTDQCRDVGIHIAGVIINSATDPGAKSIYEQDREKMVRATAETCTTQGWSDLAAKCYLKANTTTELKTCETKYTPPQPRPRPGGPESAIEPQTRQGSGAGAGSAVAPRAGAGSTAAPRAGAGSAAAPRAGAGSAAAPRTGASSAAAPRAGAGSSVAPRAGAGAGSGSARP